MQDNVKQAESAVGTATKSEQTEGQARDHEPKSTTATQPGGTSGHSDGRSNGHSDGRGEAKKLGTPERLPPCPETPNCVSTLASDEEHAIAPIAYRGSLADAKANLLSVLQDLPRATLVTSEDNYIHMEYRSWLFRFVDDVESVLDDQAKEIHFRSAARLGRSDLGVNRRRMEKIRAAFAATASGA